MIMTSPAQTRRMLVFRPDAGPVLWNMKATVDRHEPEKKFRYIIINKYHSGSSNCKVIFTSIIKIAFHYTKNAFESYLQREAIRPTLGKYIRDHTDPILVSSDLVAGLFILRYLDWFQLFCFLAKSRQLRGHPTDLYRTVPTVSIFMGTKAPVLIGFE